MGWLSTFKAEWRVVADAPWSFAAVLAAAIAIMWLTLKLLKSQEIENLKARLQLRDDQIADYKRKLDGATPDEASARITSLEARLDQMGARRLTYAQKQSIERNLVPMRGEKVQITCDKATLDARAYAAEFADLFKSSGWTVEIASTLARVDPPSGLAIRVPEDGTLTYAQDAALFALRNAGVQVDEIPGAEVKGIDVAILIGSPPL